MSQPSPWQPAAERVVALLRSDDPGEAFAFLDSLASADDSQRNWIAAFRGTGNVLYWQHKALKEYVILSREIIRRLHEALITQSDGGDREALVRPLGGECYNLASFAWPGWDEPGITVGPEELSAGREAAALCLEIRTDPANQGVAFGYTSAMAYWVVAAYALSDRSYSRAVDLFSQAADLERNAGEHGLLNAGYAALARWLASPSTETEAAFTSVLEQLAARVGDEDAAFYREQLLTARRVFGA